MTSLKILLRFATSNGILGEGSLGPHPLCLGFTPISFLGSHPRIRGSDQTRMNPYKTSWVLYYFSGPQMISFICEKTSYVFITSLHCWMEFGIQQMCLTRRHTSNTEYCSKERPSQRSHSIISPPIRHKRISYIAFPRVGPKGLIQELGSHSFSSASL